MRTSWAVLLTALAVTACRKPQPSVEYLEASGSYTSLLAREGDDAFDGDEMGRIEQLLRAVPPSSSDAAAAGALLQTIASERKRVASEADAAARMRDALARAPEFAGNPEPVTERPAAEAEDAGAPETGPEVGMQVATMLEKFGECFVRGEPIVERGSNETLQSYRRADLGDCPKRFPAWAARLALARGGVITRTVAAAAVEKVVEPPKGTFRDAGFTVKLVEERRGVFGIPAAFVTDGGF